MSKDSLSPREAPVMDKRKNGDLQVWWIPQVPMKAFTVEVSSVAEAAKLLTVLADYDHFQYANQIKPDYSNAGGLRVWDNGDWTDWMDDESGCDDPIAFIADQAKAA